MFWKQGCRETFGNSGQKTCGQRSFKEIGMVFTQMSAGMTIFGHKYL